MSGSDNQPSQRQSSQMSCVDSAGIDSGCGSQMSRNSSSVGNFINDQQQVSPPMSQPMTPYNRGQGHFSPNGNLQVQTGFDSAMSSPMPSVSSPYSNPAMDPSPMPPTWLQQGQGHMQGQGPMKGEMPVQGPVQGPSPMQGHFCQQQHHQHQHQQQQQQVMPPPQSHPHPHPHPQQYQHNHPQMQGMAAAPVRNVQVMSNVGHYPNNGNVMNSGNMGGAGASGDMSRGGMMHGQTCPGMHGGGSCPQSMGSSMQNPAPKNKWRHSQGSPTSHQNQCGPYPPHDMMGGELPGQVYAPPPPPMPPPVGKGPMMGDEGMGGRMEMERHRPHRASPQVQVPHISQSQIPPNAKAASRNMMVRQQMMSQEQMQQQMMPPMQQQMMPPMQQQQQQQQPQQQQQVMPPPSQPPQPNMYMNNQHHNTYQNPYSRGPYPQMYPGNGGGSQIPPPNAVVNGAGTPVNPPTPDFSRRHHRGVFVPPSGTSTPTGMFRHPHPPSSQHPSCQRTRHSPHPQQHYPYPMEMSPGCNQVTSSTDRKETTAPPIEDFMENIASLSSENLIENISSESVFGSQTSLPNRAVSQNSNRYNPLLNTSNMVVNDMSSVLTQLAEENKYLSMRP